jgi:type II secretory pathway pseudopilin PulG
VRRKGVTLVELLVGLVVTALITTMLATLFASGNRLWNRDNQRSTALQSALLVMTRVREEVRDADPSSTIYVPASDGASPCSALLLLSWRIWDNDELEWDPSGAILWQSVVAVYLDSGTHQVLLRERLLSSPTPEPPPLSAADFAPQAGDVTRVVALGVQVQASAGGQSSFLDGSAAATVPTDTVPSSSPSP